MELTWYGMSCFRITERSQATVVTDPYGTKTGLSLPKLKSDITTISHAPEAHSETGAQITIDGPGEYEIGGVFVIGTATYDGDNRNIHYLIDYDTIRVVHFGNIHKVPTQAQIEALGEVNILLLPVGGGGSLNTVQASEVVSMIEPSIVIPMNYQLPKVKAELDGVDRFLKEMGVAEIEEEESLKISTSNLPEVTQVVVLKPKL